MPLIFFLAVAILLCAETYLKDSKYLMIIRVTTLSILIGTILLGVFGFLE